ncbi:uncharacterized protein RAG0_16918 [Rhynchosporium agropyri]|uniref:Uncharacterized protein n=1 Tax=Rhynchosporium agropyri TaxID=914238 RepID=A0A1E1LSI2_9HELO|nr:uncharacterized protein RAG0_16918 [Rhynchosporium agropyri]
MAVTFAKSSPRAAARDLFGGSEDGDQVSVEARRVADCEHIAPGVAKPEQSAPVWSFSIQPAHEVKTNIGTYLPPAESHLPSLLNLGQQWLSRLCTTGELCYPVKESEIQPYAKLPHCWGKRKTLRLLTTNIDQLHTSVNLRELPASYQEAILVCNSAAAENADSSFIARDASTMPPLPITIQWEGHEPSQFYLSNENAYRDEVASSPFDKRVWVVQEVWLASWNLYLTKN